MSELRARFRFLRWQMKQLTQNIRIQCTVLYKNATENTARHSRTSCLCHENVEGLQEGRNSTSLDPPGDNGEWDLT